MKLWFTNKHGKVVLNAKTINGLLVCSHIFRLLKQVFVKMQRLMLIANGSTLMNDVFGERVRSKSTNPGSSWDSNPRPSEY